MTSMIIHSALLRVRVARVAERVHNLEPLEHLLLAMLRAFVDEPGAELFGDLVDVDALQELANRGRADIGEERVVAFVLGLLPEVEVLVFVEQLRSGPTSCSPGSMTT